MSRNTAPTYREWVETTARDENADEEEEKEEEGEKCYWTERIVKRRDYGTFVDLAETQKDLRVPGVSAIRWNVEISVYCRCN